MCGVCAVCARCLNHGLLFVLVALSLCRFVALSLCCLVNFFCSPSFCQVREDYGQAERYALQAVKSREHGLCEQLAEEKEQALLRSGGGKKKDEDKTLVPLTPLPYLKDPRMQGIMEESVGFLKNIHMKSFLTPWRFLIWKGT